MKSKTVEATENPEDVIVTAARGDHDPEWVGEKSVEQLIEESGSDTKEEFIHRIMDRGHWGVTEHPQITMTFQGVSRVVMAQVTRHRILSWDVQSMRYVDITDGNQDLFFLPKGMDGWTDEAQGVFNKHLYDSVERYKTLIDEGVDKEQARRILPLSTKINLTVSGNLRSLLHFLDIRDAANVQGETVEFAKLIKRELVDWCPEVVEYYEEEFNPRKHQLAP